MAPRIRTIPATLNQFNSTPVQSVRKKLVAGYARVSTDQEEQLTSYEAQMSYYKSYIESREDWEFVGMYSDEGITATNTRKRDGFNRMVEDALAGKIDLIITKSVSRFARNTVDSLTTIRKLKEKGIEVYFEKENIWTLDSKGELMITIMSSLAQEESRSISENTTWGKRKQFADGKCCVAFSRFLGYDEGFKINEEQAETVRLIYKLFISGHSIYSIAKELDKRGIKAPGGKSKWHDTTLKYILTNEKYRGDALLQKQYTTDFLQKRRKDNHGEVPQYYVEEHHEPIIPPEQFDFVQAIFDSRANEPRHSGASIFSSKIKCGCCGNWYGPVVWHSNDRYRKVVYRCTHKYKDSSICTSPTMMEEQIKDLFMKALNTLVDAKEETIENLRGLVDTVCCTDALLAEQANLMKEIDVIAESITKIIRENARVVQSQEDYIQKEATLRTLIAEKQTRYQELNTAIREKNNTRGFLENLIKEICGLDGHQTEFREELWGGLVDHVLAGSDKTYTVVFRGGIEVPV